MIAEDQTSSLLQVNSDQYGYYVVLRIDASLYSDIAILKTSYWFTDQCYLFLSRKKDSSFIDVEFRLKEGDSLKELKNICGQFSNYILDQEIRQRVINETKAVRDTLIKKAFFEAKARLPDKTISNEVHLPNSSQSYVDDPLKIGS